MNLLFKNIPLRFNENDLAETIETIFLAAHGDINDFHVCAGGIELLERQDCFCHPLEKFAVLRISPPNLAKKVIEELDGCLLDKLKITVREFFIRSSSNDPRGQQHDKVDFINENRVKDRRQHALINSRHI